MTALSAVYSATIGKKAAMALTGVIMVVWLFAHMLGNLQIFMGPETLNAYAAKLQSLGPLLWVMRLSMLAVLVVHVWSAISLIRTSRAAASMGPQGGRAYLATTQAARSMRWGGVVLVLFIVFHLLDLTVGVANPDFIRHDVYHNVIATFSNPAIAAFYIVAQLALGMHLLHGVWSTFHTLGLNHPSLDVYRTALARGIAAVIVVGNVSIPVAVLAGLV